VERERGMKGEEERERGSQGRIMQIRAQRAPLGEEEYLHCLSNIFGFVAYVYQQIRHESKKFRFSYKQYTNIVGNQAGKVCKSFLQPVRADRA